MSLLTISNLLDEREYYKSQFKTTCELVNIYGNEINLYIKWIGDDELQKHEDLPCNEYLLEK